MPQRCLGDFRPRRSVCPRVRAAGPRYPEHMAKAGVADNWMYRIAQAIPLGPAWTGIAVAVVVFGLFVLWDEAFAAAAGQPAYWRFWQDGGARTEPLFAVLRGFIFGTIKSGTGGRSILDPLRPALRCSDAEYANLVREFSYPNPNFRRAAGVLGVLGGLAVMVDGNVSHLLQRATWDSHFGWVALNVSVVCWMLGVVIFWSVRQSRLLMRVQREFVEIDLMDLSSLTLFARESLRAIVFMLIGGSLGALVMVVSGLPGASMLVVLATILVNTIAVFYPVRGLHHRIREAKRQELELVNEKVRRERDRILESDGPDAEAASGKLPGLVAYKQFVESVSEWPIDTSTLLRFALYLGLPIGSWLGGALVERLLDLVLD